VLDVVELVEEVDVDGATEGACGAPTVDGCVGAVVSGRAGPASAGGETAEEVAWADVADAGANPSPSTRTPGSRITSPA